MGFKVVIAAFITLIGYFSMNEQTFAVISSIFALLLGIIGFLVKGFIDRYREDLEKVKKDSESIKSNYLSRFEEIKNLIHGLELKMVRYFEGEE